MKWVVALLALGLGVPHAAPLSLEQVHASVDAHHPVIGGALADIRAAEGELVAAQGGFDPQLDVTSKLREGGYYSLRQVDAQVTVPTALWGTEFSVGYRFGQGVDDEARWPSYSPNETLDGGEVRAGVAVPLWRDGPIDKRRAQRRVAGFQVREANAVIGSTRASLMQKATASYWKWTLARRALDVTKELELLATDRLTQFDARVKAGLLAPIELLEARRSLLSRRAKRIKAQRKLEAQAILLSLFVRDADGRPQDVRDASAPDPLPQPPPMGATELAIEAALACHPRLVAKRAKLAGLGVKQELADARVAPKVDLKLGVSRDLGEGSKTLPGTVVEGGIVFSMPLALRTARGEQTEASARLRAQAIALGLDEDKIAAEIRDTASAFQAAAQRADVEAELAQAARELAAAERRRFDAGATTLMVVNIREQSMAEATLGAVQATAEMWHATARWSALTACVSEEK